MITKCMLRSSSGMSPGGGGGSGGGGGGGANSNSNNNNLDSASNCGSEFSDSGAGGDRKVSHFSFKKKLELVKFGK